LEVVLNESSLKELGLKEEDKIAVIGGSHSAMLCLMNLS
jgi:hypothetical protein